MKGTNIKDALSLQGAESLQIALVQLPDRVRKNGLRSAMLSAGQPVVRQSRRNVKRESGTLSKSMAKKVKTYASGNVAVIIGADRKKTSTFEGRKRVPANYISMVEKGVAAHAIGKRQHPGAKAQPFLEPAYQATKTEVSAIAAKKLGAFIDRQAAKLKGNK